MFFHLAVALALILGLVGPACATTILRNVFYVNSQAIVFMLPPPVFFLLCREQLYLERPIRDMEESHQRFPPLQCQGWSFRICQICSEKEMFKVMIQPLISRLFCTSSTHEVLNLSC